MTTKTKNLAGHHKRIGRRLVVALAFCLCAGACSDSAIVWKSQVKSPDGRWLALANMTQYGGPGTSGLMTKVVLSRSDSDEDGVEVLLLNDEIVQTAYIQMHWLSPTHLEIAYYRKNEIEFQAIKCAGIDVSLRAVDQALPLD